MKRTPLVIYHRLESPEELESLSSETLQSLDGIECDLRMTKDGLVVVHHDRRVLNGDSRYYWIDKLTEKELRQITETVFTFEDFLVLFSRLVTRYPKLFLDIDLKQPRMGMEREIARLLKVYHVTNVLVCSPDIWILTAFEEVAPYATIGLTYNPEDKWDLLTNKTFRYPALLLRFLLKPFIFRLIRRKTVGGKGTIEIASMQHKLISPGVISFLHDNNIKLYAWGTDKEQRLHELVQWGVDGIKVKK